MKDDINPMPKTSQFQYDYNKHPTGLDLNQLPAVIVSKYHKYCEYKYIPVSGFGEVPIPTYAILGIKHNKIDINTIPLIDYSKGFIQGYNTNLIPFIDSIDTRVEVVLRKSIFKGGRVFTESYNEKSIEYKAESMYKSGLFEGKRYKAWEIIFETPLAFIEYFKSLPSPTAKVQDRPNISKVDEIKNEKADADYTSQDKNEIITHIPIPKAKVSISFNKNNYEAEIIDWNNNNNNNLTKWLASGQMIEIEKWLFVNNDILHEQKQVLNNLDDLINMPFINRGNLHNEIIDLCISYANSIETSFDSFFADTKDIQITIPFRNLCTKIIKQPSYLIKAHSKYSKDLHINQVVYYRYKYLNSKLGFERDKFGEYKKGLKRSLRIELSGKNKDFINSIFLFIEQFIDDLNCFHRTQFNYIESPLFRLLFEEVVKFKDYYIATFGNFKFTNILKVKDALNTLEPILIDIEVFTSKEIKVKPETNLNKTESNQKLKSKTLAICAFFLSESKIIEHDSSQELSEEVISLFNSGYKASTIKKYVNIIKSKNIDKILTPVNIQIAIPFLEKYNDAQKLAQEHLNSIEFV